MTIEKALLYTVGKGKFEEVGTETLSQITKDYPFFATAQLLMAAKLKENGIFFQNQFNEQLTKTKLFSNNPLWIDYVLNENDQNFILELEDSKPATYITQEEDVYEKGNNKEIKPSYTFEEKPFVHPIARQGMMASESQNDESIKKLNKTPLKRPDIEEKPSPYTSFSSKDSIDLPKNNFQEINAEKPPISKPFTSDWQSNNESIHDSFPKDNQTTAEQIEVNDFGKQSSSNWEIDLSAPSKIVSGVSDSGKHLEKILGEPTSTQPQDIKLSGPTKIIFKEDLSKSNLNYNVPTLDSNKDIIDSKQSPWINRSLDKISDDELEIENKIKEKQKLDNTDYNLVSKQTGLLSNQRRPIDKFGFIDIPAFPIEPEDEKGDETDADNTDWLGSTPEIDEKAQNNPIPVEKNVMISSILGNQLAEFRKPIKEEEKLDFEKEPYFTIDYFDSIGIKIDLSKIPQDKLTSQVRRFTDWLKYMKKNDPNPSDLGTDPELEKAIEDIAKTSISSREIVTETMADVFVKQNKVEKAIQLYIKLSFMEPDKSAYFAAKIQHLKGI